MKTFFKPDQYDKKFIFLFSVIIVFCFFPEQSSGDTFDTILDRAKIGIPSAQYKLGEIYKNSHIKGKSFFWGCKAANYWFHKAANQGYIKAEIAVGNSDLDGVQCGPLSDWSKTVWRRSNYWFEKAANQGSLKAKANLCEDNYFGQYASGVQTVKPDYKISYQWCSNIAAYGDSNIYGMIGQYFLGKIYYRQREASSKNESLAVALWKNVSKHYRNPFLPDDMKSIAHLAMNDLGEIYYNKKTINNAKLGKPISQNYLGEAYAHGYGVHQNYAYAIYWWQKAAAQGYKPAENHLGNAFNAGNGVNQSARKALFWYSKAADAGYAKAEYNLAKMFNSINTATKHSQKMAGYWFHKAAIQGYAKAEYQYGNTYDYYGFQKNYKKAFFWWKKAARQGYAPSEDALGEAYLHGNGVTLNTVKALFWLQKAALKNYGSAKESVYFLKHGD